MTQGRGFLLKGSFMKDIPGYEGLYAATEDGKIGSGRFL